MTTDHDPIDPADRHFDEQIARRLRTATTDLEVPTSTAAQAQADGRRRQQRTRLAAATGAVAAVVAVIAVVLTLKPLGTADVVQPPPSATEDPLEGSDLSEISAASRTRSTTGSRRQTSTASFHRYRECLSAAGFEVSYEELDHLEHTPDVPPVTYGVPPEAVEDGADQRCYEAEFKYVDILWQGAGDQDAVDTDEAFRTCLQERGIEPNDGWEEVQEQLREARIGPAECILEHL